MCPATELAMKLKEAAAARSTGLRPIHFSNRGTAAVLSFAVEHYRFVIFGKKNFVADLLSNPVASRSRTNRECLFATT